MKKTRFWAAAAAILLALLWTSVAVALDVPWPGAIDPIDLSNSQDVRANTSMALTSEDTVAVWAGEDSDTLYVTRGEAGGTWTVSTLAEVSSGGIWYPTLASYGSDVAAAWVQGEALNPGTLTRTVMHQDVGSATQYTVMDTVFGYVAPDIAVASTGQHIVFAAATNSPNWSKGNLYYTYRDTGPWDTPTTVVTYGTVLPSDTSGGIWYPKMALDSTGDTVHVVWEQKQEQIGSVQHRIWHISGDWQSGNVTWNEPSVVSPPDQTYAVRPNVAVDGSGNVHIIWTELFPGTQGITDPEAQYINYSRLGSGTERTLNTMAIQVNDNFPTWAASSVTVRDNQLCIAWHGYDGDAAAPLEEITMRCSEDAGASWLPAFAVSESSNLLSIFPTIRIDVNGQIHAAWAEFQLSGSSVLSYDMFYRVGDTEDIEQVFLPIIGHWY